MANKNLTREQVEALYKDLAKTMSTLKGAPIPEGKKQALVSGATVKGASQVLTSAKPTGDNADLVKELVKGVRASFKADDAKKKGFAIPQPRSSQSSAPYGTRPAFSDREIGRASGAAAAMQLSGIQPSLSRGTSLAFFVTGALLCAKIGVAVLEVTGVFTVAPVEAAINRSDARSGAVGSILNNKTIPTDEKEVLTTLDSRRANLEEYRRKLDERSAELTKKDTELESKLAELRQLTDQIRSYRSDVSQKKVAQLDQLANVYSAMQPSEASQLMEQLEVDISLSLLKRMPEKRIGQILALMSKDRALALTKMLSGAGTK